MGKKEIKDAIEEAKRLIIKDEFEEANKFLYTKMNEQISSKALNEKSVELLPAYFILAEANIGMGGAKLKKAEEFLIAANWNLLKSNSSEDAKSGHEESSITKEEIDRYTAALNITFGRLFMA